MKFHMVLQGKGGVGKSFVAALMAQFLQDRGRNPVCIDTDPVNATFAGYSAFGVHAIELEAAAAKWHEDSKRTASEFLQHVPVSIASGVSTELRKAASTAVWELHCALERHNKALSRATLTCALSAGGRSAGSRDVRVGEPWHSASPANAERGCRVHCGDGAMQVVLDTCDRTTVYADLREQESLTDEVRARAIGRARELGATHVAFWRPPYGQGANRMEGFVELACVAPAAESEQVPLVIAPTRESVEQL